jgi:ubiquinone/menaquinone biosynthesis C-methylase UbiE
MVGTCRTLRDSGTRAPTSTPRAPSKDAESYEKTLECTRKHLPASDVVLEVGCGTGSNALVLAPSAKQITATDTSSRMIEIAKEKAAAHKVENVRFVRNGMDSSSP